MGVSSNGALRLRFATLRTNGWGQYGYGQYGYGQYGYGQYGYG